MAINLEFVKKHPYAFGVGGVFLFILLYYYFSKSSSGSTAASGATGTNAYDVQLAQVDAAQGAQTLQANTALAGAQIQAGVQSQGISASQDVTNNQTAAQLAAIEAQTTAALNVTQSNNQTQVQLSQVQEQSTADQINAIEGIVNAQYTSADTKTNDLYAYLTSANNNQAAVQSQAITTQGALDTASLGQVTNVGGSQNRTAIILGATGNIPGSVAAENGATVSNASDNSTVASIASSGASLLSALLA
jgi:hypothetical protein